MSNFFSLLQSQIENLNPVVADKTATVTEAAQQATNPGIIALIAVAAAVFAAIGAILSAWASRKQVSLSQDVSVLEAHRQFQSTIRDIQKSLPPEVNEDGWQPTKQEKRIIRMYWYAVFDEWLWTQELSPLYKRLWDEVYRHGVKGGMRNQAFKAELDDMLSGPTVFAGRKEAFLAELDAIYREVHGCALLVPREAT